MRHFVRVVSLAFVVVSLASFGLAQGAASICDKEVFGPPFSYDRLNAKLRAGADPNERCPIDYGAGVSETDFAPPLRTLIASHFSGRHRGYDTTDDLTGLQLLLNRGADPNGKNNYFDTVLSAALATGWPEAVDILLRAGADPNADGGAGPPIVNWYNQVHFTWLLYWPVFGVDEETAFNSMSETALLQNRLLLANGANPNGQGLRGMTALHYASSGFLVTSVEIAAELLIAGADPNLGDKYGSTPLHVAASSEAGEFWHISDSMINLLLSAGAEIEAMDDFGQTPLHYATLIGTPEAVGLLLDAGANPLATDQEGMRPVDIAGENELLAGTKELQRLEYAD